MIAISDNLQIRKDKPSGTIIINRPNRRNALSREIVAALIQAFEDFHQEGQVRAVILTGTGTTFCAGTDLHELRESASSKDANRIWLEDVQQFLQLIEIMLRFPKPIICGVNGWVVGSGAALMLASDIVVADDSSQVWMPEARRGLFSGIAASLLSFRIGSGQASRIMLSTSPVAAAEAINMGLFHEQVATDLVWARCQQIAVEIASGARQSHLLIKQMLNETIGEGLFTQLKIGAANTAAARTTDAAIEGITSFLEKRQPNW